MRSFYVPHSRVYAPHSDELITKQSHKEECDIYNILNQYKRTGIIQHINSQQPKFEDLPDSIDFQVSLNTIIQAEDAFAALPATIRDRFGNDPLQLLQAIENPDLRTELTELGIIRKPETPRPPDPNPPTTSPPPTQAA